MLIKEFNRAIDGQTNTAMLLEWLQRKADSLRPSAWRYNRAALVFYFSKKNNETLAASVKGIKGEATDLENRTSRKKLKSMPLEKLNGVLGELGKRRSSYSRRTQLFLICGELLGLRPNEWRGSKLLLNDEGAVLKGIRVKNSKNTNGRANGDFRSIWFQELMPEFEQLIIELNAELSTLSETEFATVYRECRKLLNRVNRKLYPKSKKNITLYSALHQCTANIKNTGMTPAEQAAMLGHISPVTSTSHYGKKSSGRRDFSQCVTPDEKNIEVVSNYCEKNSLKLSKPTNTKNQIVKQK